MHSRLLGAYLSLAQNIKLHAKYAAVSFYVQAILAWYMHSRWIEILGLAAQKPICCQLTTFPECLVTQTNAINQACPDLIRVTCEHSLILLNLRPPKPVVCLAVHSTQKRPSKCEKPSQVLTSRVVRVRVCRGSTLSSVPPCV